MVGYGEKKCLNCAQKYSENTAFRDDMYVYGNRGVYTHTCPECNSTHEYDYTGVKGGWFSSSELLFSIVCCMTCAHFTPWYSTGGRINADQLINPSGAFQ